MYAHEKYTPNGIVNQLALNIYGPEFHHEMNV